MVIEHKHFDEKIREAFSGFEARPPVNVWYGIVDGMAKPAPRRLLPVLLRIAAGLALLLVASFTLWYFSFRSANINQHFAEIQATGSTGQAPDIIDVEAIESLILPHAFGLTIATTYPKPESEANTQTALVFESSSDLKPIPALMAYLSGNEPGLMPLPSHISQEILPNTEASGSFALTSSDSKDSFFALGLQVAPQYSFRRLPNSEMFGFSGIPFQSLEHHLISYNAGLTLDFQLSPRFGIRTGLNYSVLGQFILDVFAFSNPENSPLFELFGNQKFGHPQTIITSQGYIRLSEPSLFFADAQSYRVITNKQFFADGDPKNLLMRDYGISQYFSFVELPLLAIIKLVDMQRADISIKAGSSLNYLIDNEVFLGRKSLQRPIGETYGLRQFNFSLIGGMVLNVPLGKKLNLTFEPTAQVFMMPMVRDHLMIGRAIPFQYSLFSGITYGF